MKTECPLCGKKFEPTDQQLREAGWHEGANPERRAGAITCPPCEESLESGRK